MPFAVRASATAPGTPRILNLFLDWQLQESDLPRLAKWDVVVLDADQQARFPDRVRRLRELNPKIKLLAYMPSEEIAQARFSEPADYPFAKLAAGMQDAWYAKDPSGNSASFWPGSALINVTDLGPTDASGQRWNEFFPEFIRDHVMSTGLWDGVFLDNTFDGISGYVHGPLDLDRDGVTDTAPADNAAWRAGMTKMITRIHALMPNAVIMGNGGAVYSRDLDGALFEKFPSWSWGPNWKEFRDSVAKTRQPTYTTINVNTSNDDRPNDFRLMRFGLASALLGDGNYSFDRGDWHHDVIWWYDEYELTLGKPRAAPRIATAAKGKGVVPAVWSRDYDKALVLLNSTDATQQVKLPGVYERLRGMQDPATNDGALVDTVSLPARDAAFLLRRSDAAEIRDAAFTNGAFVRAYDGDGTLRRNGFFANREDAPSGAQVVGADIDRDGTDDLLVAKDGKVDITFGDGGRVSFRPFAGFTGPLSVAVGNANRDAALELVLARASGGPPEVAIFSARGKKIASWLAYNRAFTGGMSVAIGDMDGDGKREIVTGAGPTGGPHVRVWKTDGLPWGLELFAFDASEVGGISVALGDIDGDGHAELVVGSGLGAIPRVRVFNADGSRRREIRLGDKPLPTGLRVAIGDTDGDGLGEILVAGLPAFQ